MHKANTKQTIRFPLLIISMLIVGFLIFSPTFLKAQTADESTTTTEDINACETDIPDCEKPNAPTETIDEDRESVSETLKQSNIANAWALSLDVVNVIAIFALLAIAFANILHIDVETWNFKRMIPALILGIIAANLSHLICRAIIDFAGMLMAFFIPPEHAKETVFTIIIGMFGGWYGVDWAGSLTAAAFLPLFNWLFGAAACIILPIIMIVVLIPGIIIFILWVMLALRTYILWFLVIIAPIAFFGFFIPPLKKLVERWVGAFFTWTFMGPVAYFFLYLAAGFARDESLTTRVALECFKPASGDQVGGFTKFLFINALLLMAIIVPYIIGGKIFNYAWKYAGQYAAKGGAYAGGLALTKGAQLGGGIATRLGKATRWKGLEGFGAVLSKTPTSPIAALEGIRGYIKARRQAEAEALTTEMIKFTRRIAPSKGRSEAQKSIISNSENMARTNSVERLVDYTRTQGIRNNDEQFIGTGVRALAIKALTSQFEDERLGAAEALRVHFGLTVDEAEKAPFELGDRKGAVEKIKARRADIMAENDISEGVRTLAEQGILPEQHVMNVNNVNNPSAPPAPAPGAGPGESTPPPPGGGGPPPTPSPTPPPTPGGGGPAPSPPSGPRPPRTPPGGREP